MFDFYVFQSKSYKFANLYDELVYQCACMEVFLNVCLVCVQSVKIIKCVCFPSASPPKGALPSYNASILLLQ